jgi:hypothetical protein
MKTRIGLGVVIVFIFFGFMGRAQQEDFPILKGPYLGQTPPGLTPQLFAPGIISTCSQHSSAYFSRDGKEVYFSRMLPLPSVIMHMCEEDGRWTPPRVVCEGLTPGLAPDGKTLFFSTWKLWRMVKTPEGWTEPELLPDHVNFQKRQDTPYAAADGTLYFCSMFGKADGVYRAQLRNGKYAKPERIEYGISDGAPNFSPYVAPDEGYMIFSSIRPGYGVSDLYVSFHNKDGSWTKPKNMGPKINTIAKESFPFVSFDGKYLFFMSNRVSELNRDPIPDGPGNVYWVDAKIIEDLKPKKLK